MRCVRIIVVSRREAICQEGEARVRTSLFYLPSVGSKKEMEEGMVGLRPELYQQMLKELSEQAKLADEAGYDSISFTEHHFHVEGFEMSNNPILLDLFVGMQTKNIRVGQLGIVLPANNPIRVAEDIAMLDHMTGGRACAGFARGYQRRWVDIMAQQTHGIHGASPHQHDEIDAANRAAFEECFTIIKKCWTEDLLSYQGKYWNVPPGETPWDVDFTNKYGAGIENGVVKQVGVVPKPLQKPHPEIFQPFASSERSVRWCAAEGATAVLPPLHPKLEERLIDAYQQVSGKPRGQGIGILRDIVIADSDEEALQLWTDSGRYCGEQWFAPFHFGEGMLDPDTGEDNFAHENYLDMGYALVGTVDTVCRQMEALTKRLPVNWIFGWAYNGLLPHDKMMQTLELYATKVMPKFG